MHLCRHARTVGRWVGRQACNFVRMCGVVPGKRLWWWLPCSENACSSLCLGASNTHIIDISANMAHSSVHLFWAKLDRWNEVPLPKHNGRWFRHDCQIRVKRLETMANDGYITYLCSQWMVAIWLPMVDDAHRLPPRWHGGHPLSSFGGCTLSHRKGPNKSRTGMLTARYCKILQDVAG